MPTFSQLPMESQGSSTLSPPLAAHRGADAHCSPCECTLSSSCHSLAPSVTCEFGCPVPGVHRPCPGPPQVPLTTALKMESAQPAFPIHHSSNPISRLLESGIGLAPPWGCLESGSSVSPAFPPPSLPQGPLPFAQKGRKQEGWSSGRGAPPSSGNS